MAQTCANLALMMRSCERLLRGNSIGNREFKFGSLWRDLHSDPLLTLKH
jgi:hypothetical protein